MIDTASPTRTRMYVFAAVLIASVLALGAVLYLVADGSSKHFIDPAAECNLNDNQVQYDRIEDFANGTLRHYLVRKDPALSFTDPANWNGEVIVYERDGNDKWAQCRLLDR